MNLIEWSDDLAVGVPQVDDDHRRMVDEVNQLYGQLRKHESEYHYDDVPITIIDFMGELFAMFSAHFAAEESLMVKHGYDHYEQHRADHERLLDEIDRTMYDYQDGILDNDQVLTDLLSEWFVKHFQTHDLRLHSLVAAQTATA